ncbi:MAG: outer membrane beta-barrel protein, partial [Bacteroidota bacterium]
MTLTFSSFTLFAQDADPLETDPLLPAPAVEEAEEEDEDELKISGFVDAYYQAAFNTSESGDLPLVFPTSFTGQANEFGIGMVNLLVEKSMGKVGFVGQVGFGPRATDANGDVPTVQQLFVTYAPSDAVTFTLGNFGTFVGYEVIDAPVNVNYSTSYLFSNGPFFHTGLKADIALGDNFGLMVGAFNDTDTKFDVVPGLHFGGQLSATAGDFSAYLNVLAGKADEGVLETDNDDTNDFQVDLVATYEASEKLFFGLNVSDKTSSVDGDQAGGFSGAALYST